MRRQQQNNVALGFEGKKSIIWKTLLCELTPLFYSDHLGYQLIDQYIFFLLCIIIYVLHKADYAGSRGTGGA